MSLSVHNTDEIAPRLLLSNLSTFSTNKGELEGVQEAWKGRERKGKEGPIGSEILTENKCL